MATNTLTLSSATRSTGAAGRATALVRGFVAFARTLRRRHELQMLTDFDDRMLADIGLTRGDLRDAVAEPMWRDPTAILVTRVHERRRVRHFPGLMRAIEEPPRVLAAPSTVPACDARSSALSPARSRYD